MSWSGLASEYGAMEKELAMTRLCLGVGNVGGGNEVRNPPVTDDDDGRTTAWHMGRQIALESCAARKKTKQWLSVEQEEVLERSFRRHAILPKCVKHDLARELHLKPYKVSVWFQNRRTLSKLKRMELEVDLLRQHCHRLTTHNAQLRQEVYYAFTAWPAVPPSMAAAAMAGPSSSGGVGGARKVVIKLD